MSQPQSSISGRLPQTDAFTLIEVLVAVVVLLVGLLGIALLVGDTMAAGTRARYANMANVLASEKLDSLDQWPASDSHVEAGGALTGPTICASGDNYCDEITVSESSGADYETQTQTVNGTAVTTTIVHTSSGCVDTPVNCGVPTPSSAGSTFTRRWLITSNPTVTSTAGSQATVTGSRRITVMVTLDNLSIQPPVTFQMSMVRP